MSPSDQVQDLFDRALSSIPAQPVPSVDTLYDRLGRHRVRSFFPALGGSIASTFLPRGRHPRVPGGRLRPSLAMTALAVITVVALVAGLAVIGSKDSPTPVSPSTSSGALSFRLVDMSASPFRSLSPGATVYLQCVTNLVCYSFGDSQKDFFRSTTGGAKWERTASLPIPTGGLDWTLLAFSCPTMVTCAIVYTPYPAIVGQLAQFIFTSDGGAHWKSSAIPTPTGAPITGLQANRLTCANATHCLLSVTGSSPRSPSQREGTFLSTSDAGGTWTQAASVSIATAGAVMTLNCSADGSCLAISALERHSKSYVVGLRSNNWGLTWQGGAPTAYNNAGLLYASCGDATHCMLVPAGDPNVPYEVVTTSNAGVTWRVSKPPVGWENMPTAISCANANDCWIAMSTYNMKSPQGVYSEPAIETTRDGGATWSSVGLPTASPPIGDVVTLSCPSSGDGCMGIANLQDHMLVPSHSSRPHPYQPQSGPLVMSNLPAAN